MGTNLSAVCHLHKERIDMLIGTENAILKFYLEHSECYKKDRHNLEVGMDNNWNEPSWLYDPEYYCKEIIES